MAPSTPTPGCHEVPQHPHWADVRGGWVGSQDFHPQQPGMRPHSLGSLETCGESRLLPELGSDEASLLLPTRVLSEEAL